MPQRENKMERELEAKVIKIVEKYQKGAAFTQEKLTDTPSEALSVVNRRYVNLNGTVASRPVGSVATIGQRYFATDTNIPMTYNGTNWRDGVGSVVAIN